MTVLIVGGAYQGKKDFAKQLFELKDNDFADINNFKDIYNKKAINNLHKYIKIHNIYDASEFANLLKNKVIICNEIGCGVVPVEKELDDWREITGRVCCEIARFADIVIRVTAGIPQVIKGRI